MFGIVLSPKTSQKKHYPQLSSVFLHGPLLPIPLNTTKYLFSAKEKIS